MSRPAAEIGDHWSTHLLTEFIALVLSYADVETAYVRGLERIVEAVEAEVGAIVGDDAVTAVVGFPRGSVPQRALAEIARTRAGSFELPHLGTCVTEVVTFDEQADMTVVIARLDGLAFTPAESSLLRGMIRTLLLCTRMLRTLMAERSLRETGEVLVAVERAIAQRAPLQEVLDAITAGARRLLNVDVATMELHDPTDASSMLLVSSQGLDSELVGSLQPETTAVGLLARAVEERRLVVSGAEPGPAEVGAMMAAPVMEGGVVIGALGVTTLDQRRRYPPAERELLSRFAEHASLALTDARTVERLSQAMRDPLTGLANRGLFIDRLQLALARADVEHRQTAVLFCDLDEFKVINDTLGHTAGDAVLQLVAGHLRRATRETDLAARLGGDEFAILLEDVSRAAEAIAIAERIVELVAEPALIGDQQVKVGISIGVVLRAAGREGADELLRNADLAMYRSKETGKLAGGKRPAVYEPWMYDRLRDQASLDADLRDAVEAGSFEVAYQPILDLATRAVVGVEALARWRHPVRGPIPPSVFIPLAEERGLIQRLGALVLATACDDVRRWRQGLVDHAGLNLSVNISAVQLHDPAIVDQIGAAVEHSGLAPADLVLEVTESALAQDPAVAAERLRRLRQLGVRVAIDDFGTGHSSLSYLRQVPTDLIKIDKVFIDEIGPAAPGGSDGTLVRAILRLIDDVGLESVAEGIEQPEQAIELAAMGCRYGQGYAFCRPLPAPEMAGYLANTGSRWPSRT